MMPVMRSVVAWIEVACCGEMVCVDEVGELVGK